MTSKRWRCAVIGTATVGKTHVRVIPNLPNATLVAVCDSIPERARGALEAAKRPDVPIYKDAAEMLTREQIDVVHLATPSGLHYEGCKLAMQRGKNVICEKPLEIRLELIDRLIEMSDKSGLKLATIFQNRYSDANRAIKNAADEGTIRPPRVGWLFHPVVSAGQILRGGRMARDMEARRRRRDHESIRTQYRPSAMDRRAGEERERVCIEQDSSDYRDGGYLLVLS